MEFEIGYREYVTIDGTYNKLKSLIENMYENRRSGEIDIISDDLEDSYITIDFDRDLGDPSVYIDIRNLYLRSDRTLNEVLYILKEELNIN